MPGREKLNPIALRIIKSLKLTRKSLISLQNKTHHIPKIPIIFHRPFLKNKLVNRPEVHQLDTPIERNPDIVQCQVAVDNAVVEEAGVCL